MTCSPTCCPPGACAASPASSNARCPTLGSTRALTATGPSRPSHPPKPSPSDEPDPRQTHNATALGLDGLSRALKNWSDSKSGRRKGPPMGFPRWKKKGRARDACRFTTGQIKVLPDRKHVQLPRLGVLKTHESTRKLARRLEQNTARILAATVTRTADRWFVSFDVEVHRHLPTSNGKTTVVGVDAGIRHLAVLSTGAPPIPNPRPLESSLRRLRRAGRELARRKPGSRRRDRTRRRLARVHAHTSNIRRHALFLFNDTATTE